MKNRVLHIILLLMSVITINAQQDLFFTQQQFSRGNINPAGVGNTDDIDLFLLGRLQWIGVDNAPHTILFNATNYIPRIQSGVGLTVAYDALGVGHRTTEVKAEYSYQIDLTPKWVLSLGASAGVFVGDYNPGENKLIDESERKDYDNLQDKQRKITPDFNIGVEASSMNWTFGASCTHIQNTQSTSYRSDRHFYAYAIRAINLQQQLDLMINLAYMNRNKVHLAEVGLLTFYDRFVWGGFSWRPDLINGCNPSYLSVMLGIEYHIFRVGYVYECGLGSRSTLPSNTHEILLSIRIAK